MSGHATEWAWRQARELPPGQALTLLAIADCADQRGFAWLSPEILGEITGLTAGTVSAYFVQMRKRKVIKTRIHQRDGITGRTMAIALMMGGEELPFVERGQKVETHKATDGSVWATKRYLAVVGKALKYRQAHDPSLPASLSSFEAIRKVLRGTVHQWAPWQIVRLIQYYADCWTGGNDWEKNTGGGWPSPRHFYAMCGPGMMQAAIEKYPIKHEEIETKRPTDMTKEEAAENRKRAAALVSDLTKGMTMPKGEGSE